MAPDPHSILTVRRSHPIFLRLRGVLVLLALLSQVGFGNAQSLQCDMHGLGAMRSEPATVGVAAGSMGTHHAAHHGNPDGNGGCHCTCIGDCSAAVALPTSPSAPTLRVALVVAQPRRPIERTAVRPALRDPDGLLPFANGPPATALL